MTAISIRRENSHTDALRFRAIAGDRQAVGNTMGEALDALTADWPEDVPQTAVIIQRFGSDAYFTAEQHERMQALLARHALLTPEERQELEHLIATELDATVVRTENLFHAAQP